MSFLQKIQNKYKRKSATASKKKLWKTEIAIWSEYDGSKVELEDLARETRLLQGLSMKQDKNARLPDKNNVNIRSYCTNTRQGVFTRR